MNVIKIIAAGFWIAFLLGMTGEYVRFATPQLARLLVILFLVGSGIITLTVRLPTSEDTTT